MSSIDYERIIDAGTKAAYAAGDVIQYYASKRDELIIENKAKNDLVSQADKEAEAGIIKILQERTPELGILAEESGLIQDGQASWCIDPLDGTTNFLHGMPQYAVSLGLIAKAGTVVFEDEPPLEQETPIASIVYDPNRKELFSAFYKKGARLNGKNIHCSSTEKLADAVISTGLPYKDFSFVDEFMPIFKEAIHCTRAVRRFGPSALEMAWVACGRFDAYLVMRASKWDVAGGTLLVREAGGFAEDLYGRHPWPSEGNVICANAKIYHEFLTMLQKHLKY